MAPVGRRRRRRPAGLGRRVHRRALASTKDQLDRKAAQALVPELDEQPARAVDVLVRASESTDLVVVGSGGLHGVKALGSISERVAHEARSSVLVVRVGEGDEPRRPR
jgi:nucleotide-binding universal stress UspA family protein